MPSRYLPWCLPLVLAICGILSANILHLSIHSSALYLISALMCSLYLPQLPVTKHACHHDITSTSSCLCALPAAAWHTSSWQQAIH